MTLRIIIICFLGFFWSCAKYSPGVQHKGIDRLIYKNPLVKGILDSFSQYEAQIIYVRINRDENNIPYFKEYKWNVDDQHYFYPASMVKMPVAILAAEKINALNQTNSAIHLFTPLRILKQTNPQSEVFTDSTSSNKLPTVGHYIKKIFVVSDNDAHNRLYEFNGQKHINDRLKEVGLQNTSIITRLEAPYFDYEKNKYTNPFELYEEDQSLYKQSEVYNNTDVRIKNLKSLTKGKGYLAGEQIVSKPFDFSTKNFYSLSDMVHTVQKIIFPSSYPVAEQFALSPSQLKFIRTQMSKLPRESRYPIYDSTHTDSYVKFFFHNETDDKIPSNIRVFNKVGWAYGFLTDVSYIVDFQNKTEYILAATINVNSDGIYNDGKYEYNSIGLPYFAALGKIVYEYELKRYRKHKPNLSNLKLDYTE